MDISYILLMNALSKINFEKGFFTYEILCILLIFSSYGFISNKIVNYLYKLIKYLNNYLPKQTELEIIGWEFILNNLFSFEYPHNMKAINYYVYSKGKSKNFRYFNNKRNGIYWSDLIVDTLEIDNTPNYSLNEVFNIHLEDDIYLNLNIEEINNSDKNNQHSNSNSTLTWKIIMKLKSYKYTPLQLQDFITKCILQYDNYTTNKNKDKTYHFIYQGKEKDGLKFSTKIISDFNNPELQNYETFDNIFHSNKDLIIRDIDKLKDIEYYKRTGLKRKKGYLFYGKPGTGKTSTVMAMSNYDKRHIIEVQLHRVKTNNEFEQILNLSTINGIKFNPDNVIIFFDEIDIGTKLSRNIQESLQPIQSLENISLEGGKVSSKSIKKESDIINIESIDKLNIGTLLSRLDGIGNYAGIIIIGATNDISCVDKALYRDGRLNLINFDNATSDDLKNIIEKYYQIKLNESQLKIISNINMKISHAKIRLKLEHFETIDDLIEILSDTDNINDSESDSEIIINKNNKLKIN